VEPNAGNGPPASAALEGLPAAACAGAASRAGGAPLRAVVAGPTEVLDAWRVEADREQRGGLAQQLVKLQQGTLRLGARRTPGAGGSGTCCSPWPANRLGAAASRLCTELASGARALVAAVVAARAAAPAVVDYAWQGLALLRAAASNGT